MTKSQQRSIATGPVGDRAAARVCTLAGISLAQQKLIKFTELKRGIELSLRELDKEARRDDIINKSIVLLRFTKATCDAFIGLAAEFSSLVLPEPVAKEAKLVKAGYGVTSAAAEYGGTVAAGGHGEALKTTTAMTKAAADFIPNKGIAFVVKSGAIKTDLVLGAMNADADSVKKSAIDYSIELGKFTLDALEKEKAVAFAGIAEESFKYNEELGKTFDDYLTSREEDRSRYQSLRGTYKRQAAQIQKTIDELEALIKSCAPRAGQSQGLA